MCIRKTDIIIAIMAFAAFAALAISGCTSSSLSKADLEAKYQGKKAVNQWSDEDQKTYKKLIDLDN